MIIGGFLIFKPREIFGNKCEQIFYALLMCRRKGLKMIIIKRKYDGFLPFKFRRSNKEVLNIKHNLILNNIFIEFLNNLISIFLLIAHFFYKFFSYVKIPKKWNFLHNVAVFTSGTQFLYGKIKGKYSKNKVTVDWSDEYKRKLNVTYGFRSMLDVEFPELKGKKYVCLHVRTTGFVDSFVNFKSGSDLKDVRNTKISSYKLAIEEFLKLGYIVVRIGDPSMPDVKIHNVIDYANDIRWSEKNDILLVEHCDIYMGTPSGPADLACLFEKKILMVNTTNLSVNLTYRSESLFLPKKVILNGKPLQLKKRIDNYIFGGGGGIIGNSSQMKIDFLDNSPMEILDAVKEIINFDHLSKRQELYNDFFKKKYEEYIDSIEFKPENEANEIDKARWHARLLGNKGSICNSCLSDIWD